MTDMLHRPRAVHLVEEYPWHILLVTSGVGGFTLFGIRLRFLRNPVLNSNSCLKATEHCFASLFDQLMH